MKGIDKLPIFEWFYEQGDVYITVVIKGSEGLRIPQWFYEREMETFVLGNSPTPGLTYDENGITTPMRFGESLFNCFFPWKCIIMMVGENAVIQFMDKGRGKEIKKENPPVSKKPGEKRSVPHLKIVK